jgi:glycosyltransferase involved in cell wall biosynthesis
MSRPPKVLHVTTVDMSLALLLLPQLSAFQSAGYEVICTSSPGPFVSRIEEQSIQHVSLDRSTRAPNVSADVATAAQFFSLCRRIRPDIIHTHNPKPGIYGRIGGRLSGAPGIVNTVHGLYAQPGDSFARRCAVYSLERIAASCSDAELIQNPEDLAVLRRLRVPDRKLYLLGNGIDLHRFDPARDPVARADVRSELDISPETILVGCVGRLVREKGYEEFLRAAAILNQTHPEVRLIVVGPTDSGKPDAIPLQSLDEAVREHGVIVAGLRDDVERIYSAMDIYVLASYREGLPRSAMEAAAMGLPVIATDIRGCRQVVDDRRTGMLVPVRNAAALATAIARLADDGSARARMGAAGRSKAIREFDHRRQIDITLNVYERVLRGR